MDLVGKPSGPATDRGTEVDNREVGFDNSPKVGQLFNGFVCKGLVLASNHCFGLAAFKASVAEIRYDLMEGVHEEREGDGVRIFADF